MGKLDKALLYTARTCAIITALTALAMSWLAVFASAFLCFDSCVDRDIYISNLAYWSLRVTTPCAIATTITLLIFLIYWARMRQWRRAALIGAFWLIVPVLGIVWYYYLVGQADSALPPTDSLNYEDALVAYNGQLNQALFLSMTFWTGILLILQWGREWGAPPQPLLVTIDTTTLPPAAPAPSDE